MSRHLSPGVRHLDILGVLRRLTRSAMSTAWVQLGPPAWERLTSVLHVPLLYADLPNCCQKKKKHICASDGLPVKISTSDSATQSLNSP